MGLYVSTRKAWNIYADECALVHIACQNCGHQFHVCFSDSKSQRMLERASGMRERRTLADAIRAKTIHYGDPPNVDCCAAGPTMNCDDIQVLEYWHRPDFEWTRVPELEISVEDEKDSETAITT